MLFQMVLEDKRTIDRNGKNQKLFHFKKKISHAKTKKERTRSQNHKYTLPPPISRCVTELSGKVSFCISGKTMKRASIAVETVCVLPVFFLGMITMISFMDLYKIQTQHLTKLCETAKEAGMFAYGTGGNGPEELTLPDIYSYQPIGGLLPLSKVWMHNSVKIHTWTGRDFSSWGDTGSDENETEEMVYMTETGSVYHVSPECSYLNLSIQQVSGEEVAALRNIYGEKYHACETCSRNQSPSDTAYITGNGNRYHNLETCSGLKRTVKLVPCSQAEGLHVCSRCGGGS